MPRTLIAIALLCTAFAIPAMAEEGQAPKPEKGDKPAAKAPALTVNDLPPAVKAAAEAQAAGAAIDKVRVDEKNGEKAYAVRFVRDNVKTEVKFNAEGKVLRLRAERGSKEGSVPTTGLPAAVQTAVATKLNDGKVVQIEERTEKDKQVYRVDIEGPAGRLQLEIDAAGTILKERKPEDMKRKDGEGKKDGEHKKDEAKTEGEAK